MSVTGVFLVFVAHVVEPSRNVSAVCRRNTFEDPTYFVQGRLQFVSIVDATGEPRRSQLTLLVITWWALDTLHRRLRHKEEVTVWAERNIDPGQ